MLRETSSKPLKQSIRAACHHAAGFSPWDGAACARPEESLAGDVGVDLRGGQVCVAEQLHHAQVRAVVEQSA